LVITRVTLVGLWGKVATQPAFVRVDAHLIVIGVVVVYLLPFGTDNHEVRFDSGVMRFDSGVMRGTLGITGMLAMPIGIMGLPGVSG
jgi:hypothetical protein